MYILLKLPCGGGAARCTIVVSEIACGSDSNLTGVVVWRLLESCRVQMCCTGESDCVAPLTVVLSGDGNGWC